MKEGHRQNFLHVFRRRIHVLRTAGVLFVHRLVVRCIEFRGRIPLVGRNAARMHETRRAILARPVEHIRQTNEIDLHHLKRVARVSGKRRHVVNHVEALALERVLQRISVGDVTLNPLETVAAKSGRAIERKHSSPKMTP